jgi:hypothetical protein
MVNPPLDSEKNTVPLNRAMIALSRSIAAAAILFTKKFNVFMVNPPLDSEKNTVPLNTAMIAGSRIHSFILFPKKINLFTVESPFMAVLSKRKKFPIKI